MSVDSFGYRSVVRAPGAHWRSVWAICRWNLRIVMRQKLFWLLVALGMLHFLVHYVFIYIKAQISIDAPGFAKFIDNY